MDTDPGPDTTNGRLGANNDFHFLGTAFASVTPATAKGIIHRLHLSLVPDFNFVLIQDGKKCLEKDGGQPETRGVKKINRGIISTTMPTPSTSTLTKATNSKFLLLNRLISVQRSASSSEDEDPNGGVSLQDSLRPLNHEASSLVSPIPLASHTISPRQGSQVSLDSTPLHFHRKPHHGQHEHHRSLAPGPFTCTKTRKYKLLHLPDKNQGHSNINDLANGFEHLAIHSPGVSWVYTPNGAQRVLDGYHEKWRRVSEMEEARNRYRGINMNEGWNRDAATLIQSTEESHRALPCKHGGPQISLKLKESMNRFSLWAQLEPIEWEVDELKDMFDMVFVGEGLGNSGWARKPGSWWATRKKLFDGHRGRSFLEELDLWMEEIEDGRERWKRENKGKSFATRGLKRKVSTAKVEPVGVAGVADVAEEDISDDMRKKRFKLLNSKSEPVMSKEWRARRRSQEKKAGRWTDGTLLMDQMWAGFYWVLNENDPDDEDWPREVFTRAYY